MIMFIVQICEDLVDTGKTMGVLIEQLAKQRPASTQVACLLHKRITNRPSTGYRPNYSGFEIPDKFVVGYGLDYNQKFRDLNHICVMNANGIEKYKTANV